VIDLVQGFEATAMNKLLSSNASGGVVGYVNDDTGTHNPGTPVCAFGAKSEQKRCGEVDAWSYDNKTCKGEGTQSEAEPCSTVDITMEVSFDLSPGDSGAPYWEGPASNTSPWRAMGMHTHSKKDSASNPFGWYVTTTGMLLALGDKGFDIRLCLNTSCTP